MSILTCRFSFADFLFPVRSSRRRAMPIVDQEHTESAALPGSSPELEELRGAAMRRMFPKLHAWGRRRDWASMLYAYAYLAEATTVEELEERVHHIERQRHFRH